jgi:tryptophanyl-tRNA synthetase
MDVASIKSEKVSIDDPSPSHQKRSADVLYAPRIMSGIQPVDQLHFGHYFGGMQYHVHLHHEYPGDCFFAIADYHSLMRGFSPERIKKGTLELATVYLAFGLDPNKACLYRQSDVPEIMELYWFLSCSTSLSLLMSNPAYKQGMQSLSKPEDNPNSAGLLTYPVLMAADILGIRANIVPVGHDQEADLDRVRDIASAFNKAVDHEIFPVPEMISVNANDIPGTDGRKMLAKNNNILPLFAPYEDLRNRVRSIQTEPKEVGEKKDSSHCTVFQLYSLVAPPLRVKEMKSLYDEGISYEDAKDRLIVEIQEFFQKFEERYHLLKDDPDYVTDVLRAGFDLVCDEAQETLDDVRTFIGLTS